MKDKPLAIHARARDAAHAARCAARAGKYWPYHDRLFAEQERMDRDDFLRHAAALALDGERFRRCLDSETVAEAIDRDLEEAQALGVRSTPFFLINGQPLAGAQPIEKFRAVIDDALRASGR